MNHLQFLAVGLCLAATGCGGGGSTSGGGTVIVPPPATSAPTPTPSPSPPPPIDFAHDFTFTSDLGSVWSRFTYTDSFGLTQTVDTVEDDGLTVGPLFGLNFNVSTGSLQFAQGTQKITFSASDRLGDRYFAREGNSLTLFPTDSSFKYVVAAYAKGAETPYVLGVNSGKRSTYYVGILGYRSTVTSRMEGALNFYTGQPTLRGSPANSNQLRVHGLRILINSGQNYYFGSIYLNKVENGAEVYVGKLDLKGTLNEVSNVFSGTLTDPVTGYTGAFRGALFGPNRDELAILYRFSRSLDGGIIYSGEMLARRE
ncbi:hypothetical protein ACX40Y_16750 [Sphingomonas sp. RS6]